MSSFAFCNVPIMPVRSDANHKSEQVTQLLYGERVLILETNNKGWSKIESVSDKYLGWCRYAQLLEVSNKLFIKETKQITNGYPSVLLVEDNEMLLPLGSELIILSGLKINNKVCSFKYRGKKIQKNKISYSPDYIKKTAMQFLHAPYQWGGRSLAGIDCSGFTQIVFKLCNYLLPRDASQQATKGELVDFLQNAQCGDLAFFDEADGRITHVGLLLDNSHIIHASDTNGRVTIDKIDQGGIVSTMLKKRTHHLRFIKRFFK